MPVPLRLTINESVKRPEALTTYTLPHFDALADELEKARTPGAKDESDLLVPVAEWAELHRSIPNIQAMARIFVGDVDRVDDTRLDRLLATLDNLSCILYTTHSHRTPKKNGLGCYRVIIELDEEYDPRHHEYLWRIANKRLGGLLDPGARTPEQGYYLPSFPQGYGQYSELVRMKGRAWRVSELLAGAGESTSSPAPQPPPQPETPAPNLVAVRAHINAWVRNQTDPERKAVGKAAKALLAGKNEIPVGAGERNPFLITLAGYLAHTWPRAPAAGIADHFETIGWDLFNPDGKYPITTLAGMIARMQVSEVAKLEEKEQEEAKARAEVIKAATGGARDHPITEEEIANVQKVFGEDWHPHLVAIHKRDLYFLRPDATYDPGAVMRESLFVAARDRLAVFGEHVEYTYEDAQGTPRRKTEKAFLEEYGTVVRTVVFDMTQPRGGWERDTETIVFPAAQPRVEPVEHPEVHEWLACMDDHLLDMLAVMPRFDLMLPALVLTGPANCGKTILGKGMGQIYGSDPLDAEAAFSSFNAALLTKQPIILMDEKVADAYRREGTTLVRRFLTQSSRMLDEKYQARVELRGFPRLIIAANNLDVLNTNEEMSAEDRAAFAERLVHIDLAPGKAKLMSMQPRIQTYWLNERYLAEHILWLSQNRQVTHMGDRFTVASNHTRLHDGLASRAGFAGDVAYWLLSYVSSPERANNAHLPIELVDGKLRVNTGALVQGWAHYLKDHRPPSPSQISRALKSLSTGGRQKITVVEGGRRRRIDAHEIDPLLLRSANDTHRLVDNFDDIFYLTDSAK